VAQSIVGFKHDEDCARITEGQFVVLSRSTRQRASLTHGFESAYLPSYFAK
jgi:hypothetical protein